MSIAYEGPWVVRQLAEARKKGDKETIERLELVLADIRKRGTPTDFAHLDPDEARIENLEKRVSALEAQVGSGVPEI